MSVTDASRRIRNRALSLRLAARRSASSLRSEAADPLLIAKDRLAQASARKDFSEVRHWSLVCKFLANTRDEFEPSRLSELDDGRAICRIFINLTPEDRRRVIEFATSLATKA